VKKGIFCGLLLLAACSATPQTPQQALLEGRAALGVAAGGFNVYAAHGLGWGDRGQNPPPLCAKREVVIEGDRIANEVAAAFDQAEVVINSTGVADTKWAAIGTALKKLVSFQSFVTKANSP
jgi:hypothetical protein